MEKQSHLEGRAMPEVQVAKVDTYKDLAQQLRIDSIRCTTEAGSGHPTSSMSAADLMSVLLVKYLRYDFSKPELANNDKLIFSKGHACPLLYSMYKAAGAIDERELLSLRKFGSRLEGHPVPQILPWVDVATGSLGQGLPDGVGMGLAGKYLDKLDYNVWVLMGDSETAEGSVWEALACASFYKLDNLIAILDMNRLGQRGQTELGWDSKTYADRATAFGWHAIEINGHDYNAIEKAYDEALSVKGQPTFIIAKTEKGHGVSLVANKDGWHGKPLSKEQAEEAIKELGGNKSTSVKVQKPEPITPIASKPQGTFACPTYDSSYSTREAYGDALKALGAVDEELVVVDAEVSNSSYADKFGKAYPQRFFEMFIAEQCMVGVATGLASRGKTVFASTFAAFLSRAFDFIRMGAISRANLRLCGSHAGVSIGQDGPSQMALEDLAMMRSVHGSTVFYPSDAVCASHVVHIMSKLPGISYIRTTREKTPILYKADDKFTVGGSKVLRSSAKDRATIIAAGITLHESIKAYDELKAKGVDVRVIDAYSVKPIDRDTILKAAKETAALIVVEDHWSEGGLGDAVLDVFAGTGQKDSSPVATPKVIKLAVRKMSSSGTPAELIEDAGISAKHIVEAVQSIG
jgi:transketolase